MTAKITLTWDNGSSGHVDQIVYRSTDTFTSSNLPSILARVGKNAREYVDTAIVAGNDYFYAVASENTVGEILLSSVISVTAGEDPHTSYPTIIGEAFGGGYYIGNITIPSGPDAGQYCIIMAGLAAEAQLRWKTTNTITTGTAGNADGRANTLAMQAAGITLHPAGEYCLNYRGGGYDDWYLGALRELNLAWDNRAQLSVLAMQAYLYWSSTQVNYPEPYAQNFGSGVINVPNAAAAIRFRPVRRIKLPE